MLFDTVKNSSQSHDRNGGFNHTILQTLFIVTKFKIYWIDTEELIP